MDPDGRNPVAAAIAAAARALLKKLLRDIAKKKEKDAAKKQAKNSKNKAKSQGCVTKRARRNGHLAGGKHPETGIPFDKNGYPDFSSVSKKDVKIEFTGSRRKDVKAANETGGFKKTPEGHVWHHHQDGKTMQLVPRDIYTKTGHDGGFLGG
ncbi:hypothetical protein CWN84_10590 [Vibrio splendidus]|nr:hypothetical protein CWN84_10590 [Vibrio splendidus]